MKERPHLVLVTQSYPFAGAPEAPFIESELAAIATSFTITLLPMAGSGEQVGVPAGVTTDCRVSETLNADGPLAPATSLRQQRVWRELIRARLHPRSVRRLLRHVRAAAVVASVLPALDSDVVLTYWFDSGTTGAVDAESHTGAPVVTRAHGYDVYDDRHPRGFIPLRPAVITKVRRVFVVSEAAARHLAARHPVAADRIECVPLGTRDPGFVTLPSTGAERHLVSCSSCVKVKRVDQIARAVAYAAVRCPGLRLRWTHLGGGPLLEEVRTTARRELRGVGVDYQLPGAVAHDEVLRWFRDHRCDAFVNLSVSEGRPFAVMEAMSMGVPVLGTAVGGVPELVVGDSGRLLPAKPDASVAGDALAEMLTENDTLRRRRRTAARAAWEGTADSLVLAPRFVRALERAHREPAARA